MRKLSAFVGSFLERKQLRQYHDAIHGFPTQTQTKLTTLNPDSHQPQYDYFSSQAGPVLVAAMAQLTLEKAEVVARMEQSVAQSAISRSNRNFRLNSLGKWYPSQQAFATSNLSLGR